MAPPIVRPVNAEDDSINNWVTKNNKLKVSVTAEDDVIVMYGPEGDLSKECTEPVIMDAENRQTLCFQTVSRGMLPSEIVKVTAYKADSVFTMAKLAYGWNLVSIPITLTNDSLNATLKALTFYGYDEANCCYSKASRLDEGRAYWVFAPNESVNTIKLNGTVTGTMQFDSDWSLCGPRLEEVSVPADVKAYKFENGRFHVEADKLKPGVGYMVFM